VININHKYVKVCLLYKTYYVTTNHFINVQIANFNETMMAFLILLYYK